jgi:hypothetical protein
MSDGTQEPPISDEVPTPDGLTSYDQEHLVIYLRLLDAEQDGAAWTEVTRVVLKMIQTENLCGRDVFGKGV